MASNQENTTLGRGDVYFAKRTNGVLGNFKMIGNTPSLALSFTLETLKHFSSARGVKVQDREVPVQTTVEGKFVTDNISHENLASFLLGTTATVAVAGATAQTQTFNAVKQGETLQVGISAGTPTGLRNLTSVVVKVATVAKTLGVDYTLIAERGLVTIVPGGGIADGANVTVEYGIAAHSIYRTVSGADAIEGALMFLEYNPEGTDIDYRMMDVKLAPDGEFALKAEEWQQLPFKLSINVPDGGSAVVADGQPFTP